MELDFKYVFFCFLVKSILATCPNDLRENCTCYRKASDYFVNCYQISASLDQLLNYFDKYHIERLRVIGSSWPVVRKISKSSSVRSIELSSCSINTIEENAFEELAGDLEEITLTNNSITLLPVFGRLSKVNSLNFNFNQLKDIGENAFENLPNLRYLRLQGNHICTISRRSLSEIKATLQLLDLKNNCLEVIPAANFRSSLQLEYLDLSANNIKKIESFEFMNLPILKELRMNDNQISSISTMAFVNIPKLESIYLSNNQLSTIDNNFQLFPHLQILDLSRNQLIKIPTLKDLSNLRQIHLDFNKITRIETLSFSQNSRLQLINLQNNEINAISRNSFDSLNQLYILLLANNRITDIGRGTLDGMRNLQQLNLRNNSIHNLSNLSFASISLINILDLSKNHITNIENDAFKPLIKLFWLDLSSNNIQTLNEGTFSTKIANILLHENPLKCDEKIDWLVKYLVENQVRTFFPRQPDVLCSKPERYAGVRLKELMIRKVNETRNSLQHSQNFHSSGQNIFTNLLPAGMETLLRNNFLPNKSAIQIIDRNLTARNFGRVKGRSDGRKLKEILKKLSSPFGGEENKLTPSDIETLVNFIPNHIISVPGMGEVDINKMPPGVIEHVLRGGQIPGVPKQITNDIINQLIRNAYSIEEQNEHEEANSQIHQSQTGSKTYLNEFIDPSRNIKNEKGGISLITITPREQVSPRSLFNTPSEAFDLMSLLPPGYNISKIPREVIESIMHSEMPDLNVLPTDLQKHFITNSHRLISAFLNKPNITIEDILKRLPKFERPAMPTYSPYSIDEVRNDLAESSKKSEQLVRLQQYTTLLLSTVGTASIAILCLLCIYMRRKRSIDAQIDADEDSLVNPVPLPLPQTSNHFHQTNCANSIISFSCQRV